MRWTLTHAAMHETHRFAAIHERLTADRAAQGGQFLFPAQQVGTTQDGRVTLYYDPALGNAGLQVAQAVLPMLDGLFAGDDAMFGVAGKAGNILLAALPDQNGVPQTDGSTGAFHAGCAFNDDSPGGSDWYEDIALGDPEMTLGLIQAEVSESYMGLQNRGWDCGGSNGEALSRVLAEAVSGGPNGSLRDYTTGPAWAQAGFPDFIDTNAGTDRDPVSTGCGVVYLYWMLSQGHMLNQIVLAGCPDGTLASNYQTLTGLATAWNDFLVAVNALPNGITGDNPF